MNELQQLRDEIAQLQTALTIKNGVIEQLKARNAQLEDRNAAQAEPSASSGWIPVTERLPDMDGKTKYLVSNAYGYITIANNLASSAQLPNFPEQTLSGWLCDLGRMDCVIGAVTHWMPLPAAPKGGE